MLYPVELWDQTGLRSSQGTKMCRFFLHPMSKHEKRERFILSLVSWTNGNGQQSQIAVGSAHFREACLCSFSCPFWTSCQLQQKHPWSNIRQKQTCCRTRPWCPLTLKRLWSSSRQTWTCRMTLFRQWKPKRLWRSIRQTWTCRSWPSCHPWSRFALFWLFCRLEPLWTERTRSMRRRRMRRGRGTFSLCC